MAKKQKQEEPATAADGEALFPLPDTPLGKACRTFVQVADKLGETKAKLKASEAVVLEEMKKENRARLNIPIGKDSWEFSIKRGEDKVRCVKKTRQPKPKTEAKEEEPAAE